MATEEPVLPTGMPSEHGDAGPAVADHDASPTFMTEGKAPPEELAEDDLGDLEALVSGVTQTSQSTLLLKKRKEMREIDVALKYMKKRYHDRMQDVEQGEMEFKKKQVEMKRMVSKFEKFIQENDAKTRRAEMKMKAEIEAREQCESKIIELQKQEQELNREREQLKSQLESVRKYEAYLDSVVQDDEGYQEIPDVIMRHKTLKDANDDLEQQSKDNNTAIESTRLALVSMRQQQQNRILVMNGEAQDKQKLVEALRVKCSTLAIDKESKERYAKDRTMEYGAVVMSIKNLYHRCHTSYVSTVPAAVKEKGVPLLQFLSASLDAVGGRIQHLQETKAAWPDWDAENPATAEELAAPSSSSARHVRGGGTTDKNRTATHRARHSSGSSHSMLHRATGSDVSAAGFHPDDSVHSRGNSHRRHSDVSSGHSAS